MSSSHALARPVRIAAILGCLVLAAVLPAAALAHKPATAAQRKAITAAVVRRNELTAAQAACQTVTISTVNTSWAALTWPAHLSKACMKVAADGIIIEHYTAGSWHFVVVGSDVECTSGGMPKAVGEDLIYKCATK